MQNGNSLEKTWLSYWHARKKGGNPFKDWLNSYLFNSKYGAPAKNKPWPASV